MNSDVAFATLVSSGHDYASFMPGRGASRLLAVDSNGADFRIQVPGALALIHSDLVLAAGIIPTTGAALPTSVRASRDEVRLQTKAAASSGMTENNTKLRLT